MLFKYEKQAIDEMTQGLTPKIEIDIFKGGK